MLDGLIWPAPRRNRVAVDDSVNTASWRREGQRELNCGADRGPAGVGLRSVIEDIRVRDRPADVVAALRSAQGGDEVGFRVLYRDMQPRLLRYLRVLVAGDAEDVASEAWLQISRDLAAFCGDLDDFRGWATAVARNRALDHLRRQRRRPPTGEPLEALEHVPAHQDTAQTAVDAIGTDAALQLIAELPPDQAEAVLLRVIIGLDAQAAARVLGKRPGAVRTAAYRGLNRLAERLDQLGVNAGRESAGVTLPSPPTLRKWR
jgi:RNA polymerase sigma-70 factor (ECF subfamily)